MSIIVCLIMLCLTGTYVMNEVLQMQNNYLFQLKKKDIFLGIEIHVYIRMLYKVLVQNKKEALNDIADLQFDNQLFIQNNS